MPDVPALESLVVENFRSIRGEVVVPLNAPVVLIHGPNGTGKSSLMTALALALAGPRVTPVAGPRHLVHHGAAYAAITLATSVGPQALRIHPDDDEVGAGVLEPASAAFFAERCYLEQTKLSGLLKAYEETTKGAAESALTRFVKELLRIDEVDALVEGLHASGHVTRVERELPTFKTWRSERSDLDRRAAEFADERKEMEHAMGALEIRLQMALSALGLRDLPADEDAVEHALRTRQDLASTARLETLEFRVRELAARDATLDTSGASAAAVDATARLEAARERRGRWQAEHGVALETVLSELRSAFPRLPALETVSPSDVYDEALERIETERARLTSMLADDDRLRERQDEAERSMHAASARLATLDAELADERAPGEMGELARLLADLAPHLTGDVCPVCGRDYAELGQEPLSSHLAAEIARLSARAGQLQSAARARLETTADLRRAEATAGQLAAQRLPAERHAAEEQRLATLTTQADQLRRHERGAREGATIMRELVAAEAAMTAATRRNDEHARWLEERHEVALEAASALAIDPPVNDLDKLLGLLGQGIEQLRATRERGAEAIRIWEALRRQRMLVGAFTHQLEDLEARRSRQNEAVDAVTRRMEDARALLHRVNDVRHTIITGVFNEALNRVWADLFVRLAPDEEYVPAFCAPSETGPLKAEFETRRRDGTTGGKPDEMLSAGNLNTAALTLFLALHLSVHRRLPWLLLDDPVQSMDEIHVSQFAALLRTLTQQAPQRRVVIAVHERALFEYLALELSPASPAGGLITVELRRERGGGDSTALPLARSYEEDRALTAA